MAISISTDRTKKRINKELDRMGIPTVPSDEFGNPYDVIECEESITMTSAGPDGRFGTPDDVSVTRYKWPKN